MKFEGNQSNFDVSRNGSWSSLSTLGVLSAKYVNPVGRMS